MKLGNNNFFLIILTCIFSNFSFAQDKITSTPLINIDDIKPSFEVIDDDNDDLNSNLSLKEKESITNLKSSQAILIGLDKITAKSSTLIVNSGSN